MKNLIEVQNKDGQLVVSSRQVAEDFNKDHRVVVRAIENKIESLTVQNCSVKKLFIPSMYNHNGNEYKEYLLTRDGFTFIVMGFTGIKADSWKLKYIEVFNQIEKSLNIRRLTPIEQLKLQYQVIEEHEEKLSNIENKVNKLENSMTIDYEQQEKLSRLAREKIVRTLGGKGTPAYKKLNKKVFSEFWRDYKRIIGVNSYKNTAVKDMDKAEIIIDGWKPSEETGYMILGANSQITF